MWRRRRGIERQDIDVHFRPRPPGSAWGTAPATMSHSTDEPPPGRVKLSFSLSFLDWPPIACQALQATLPPYLLTLLLSLPCSTIIITQAGCTVAGLEVLYSAFFSISAQVCCHPCRLTIRPSTTSTGNRPLRGALPTKSRWVSSRRKLSHAARREASNTFAMCALPISPTP